MTISSTKITIVRKRKPQASDINEEINWFFDSLGLFGSRDKDKSCYRMFITLLKAHKYGQDLSSDEIAESVDLSRGTVIHHLNKLMRSGLVISRNKKYGLKYDNLSEIIDEMEREMFRLMEKIKSSAKEIDDRMGI